MAGGGESDGKLSIRSLEETPTWALATVCFVFIFISLLIEHFIHRVSHWLKTHRKTALFQSVEKLKSVLIVLGFMSLILTVTQKSIAKICIPHKVANKMLPCHGTITEKSTDKPDDDPSDYCGKKGMASLISEDGLNQLNIFIFVLAVMQIVYSVLTMALGRAKMRRWKVWESETQTVEYQASNDPNRFRITRQTTFARRHMSSCSNTSIQLWIKCFFRQFFNSVAKVDYLTLRHGFIAAHVSSNNTFNFRKYIQRSLDDDFKSVVGISPFMWFVVVIFMLLDVHGSHVYLWVSFLPLIIVGVLGTKLEVIVAEMALQLQNENTVTKGALLVQPNDNLFWFSHPKFVLILIHYTLFMNAFELAFFVWVTWQFGIKSCYHESIGIIITRVVLAVTVQVICSYITLPLYALVTQMGSQFKGAALEAETANVMRQWHLDVKHKRKKQQQQDLPLSPFHHRCDHLPISPPSTATNGRTIASPDFHPRDQLGFSDQSTSSPSHLRYNRSPTFADISSVYSSDNIRVVVDDREIFQESAPSSATIEMNGRVENK